MKSYKQKTDIFRTLDIVLEESDFHDVERFSAVEIKKVGAIVGDERELLVADDEHKLPIF